MFGDAIGRIQGEKGTSRDIYFALYQALGVGESDHAGLFREYAPDFFDLVVVDECHRGSAREDSQWRGVLEHFSGAVQLGLTATPLREIPDRLYTTPQFERVVSLLERTRLGARGMGLADLAQRSGAPADVDAFDLLLHIAWNGPLVTRRERAQRLRRDQAAFMASFQPEARAVLDLLLETYAEHGIGQIDDLAVLQVPPVADMGTVVEIADRFGGREDLQRAVEALGQRLYAA